MNVLDLFSGIGGFTVGLQRTGGFRTLAFCESNEYCRALLQQRFRRVVFEDVRQLDAELLYETIGYNPIDVICGGFPCQDISHAGSRAGIDGERSKLWTEYARLLGELRPRYAIVENVSALTVRGLAAVLGDLAEIGFDAEWHCIPAAAIGAPHHRDRIWIIAYAAGLRWDEGERAEKVGWRLLWPGQLDRPSPWATAENNDEVRSNFLRIVDGLPDRVERLNALGNAVTPIIPQIIGEAILERERMMRSSGDGEIR